MAEDKKNQPHSGGGEGATQAPVTDETDLVDASQLPTGEEEVTEAREREPVHEPDLSEAPTARTPEDQEDPFALQMEAAKPGQTTIASIRERLAAFLVDCGVLWLLYWGTLWLFHKFTVGSWIGPVPIVGYNTLLFHGAFLLIAFLYFFLLEAVFFATVGKFCCWMYVRRKDGHHAGALAIFIRNFFRLIEFCTGGLLTWPPMELSRRHQRLGDLAAGTIVIKKHSATARYYAVDANRLASAFGRSFALVADAALVLIWLIGYLMLINYQAIYLSQWMVLLFPVFFVLFWTIVQLVMEATPGLWLLGYTVTHEDGGRLTFAGALLRTLLAPLDLLLGLPCMLLSLRKQKVGDMLAATVVSHQRRRWKGAIGCLAVIAVSVGLVALGLFVNPVNNIFKAGADFKLSFMPMVEGLPEWESAANVQPPVLTVRNFRFSVGDPNTRRTPPIYEPGETVYLLFELFGYTRKDRLVWIQEDLMVQYPDGTIGLKQENVIDYHQLIKPGGAPIELSTPVALPPAAAPGVYVVTVTLRDLLANNYTVTETQSFTVKAPPSMTSPLEAPPPPPAEPPPPSVGEGTMQIPQIPQTGQTGEGTVQTTPTVPSSPLPVTPAQSPTPPAGEPARPAGEGQDLSPTGSRGEGAVKSSPSAPSPTPAPAGAPPAQLPGGGFTVIPGPSIAPKEETGPPPTIPVPKVVTPPIPADLYGAKPLVPAASAMPPVDVYAKPTAPVTPVVKPGIEEKTLQPSAPPADVYAKPVPVTPAPVGKKATPAKTKGPVTETQRAAEKELHQLKAKPEPAKPAADIPSAETVKKQSEPPAKTETPAPKKKKKAAGGGGGDGGGYMP